MRLPMLPSSLCRVGGDTCDDFAPDSTGLCRHHVTGDVARDPACVLALAEDGPMDDTRISDVLRCSPSRVGQIATRAMAVALRRASLMRLHDAVDAKPAKAAADARSAGTQPPPRTLNDAHAACLAAIGDGCSTTSALAARLGLTKGGVSVRLRALLAHGLVVRLSRGHWAVVPQSEAM